MRRAGEVPAAGRIRRRQPVHVRELQRAHDQPLLPAQPQGLPAGRQDDELRAALDAVNATLPHYKQVRAFRISAEPFTIDNGLLTANGKLKRDLIARRFQTEIEEMYAIKQAV